MMLVTKDQSKSVVKLVSALTASFSDTTSSQKKLIKGLVNEAQKQTKGIKADQNDHFFIIKVKELRNILDMEWKNIADIHREVEQLVRIIITYNILNKDVNVWGAMPLLVNVELTPDNTYLKYKFHPMLMRRVVFPESNHPYTKMDLLTLARIKLERADVIYSLLLDYIDAPQIPHLSISVFRNLLGIPDNEYSRFTNLKVRIIDPIMKEINEKTDITCSYTLEKASRNKYNTINWSAKRKGNKVNNLTHGASYYKNRRFEEFIEETSDDDDLKPSTQFEIDQYLNSVEEDDDLH